MEGNNENREERRREEQEIRREERHERHEDGQLLAEGRDRKENSTRRINRLWLWFGVLILIFILLWWLWSIGIVEDITGISNG